MNNTEISVTMTLIYRYYRFTGTSSRRAIIEISYQKLLQSEQTLDMILEALEDLVQYELAVVMMYDGLDNLVVSKARGPLYTDKLDDYTISLTSRRDLAKIIETKQTYLFGENEEHLDTYHDIIDLPGNHSCLVSPLYMEDTLIGLLTLDHHMCGVYSPRIVRFIETLSKLISVNLAQSSAYMRLYSLNQSLLQERNNLLDNRLMAVSGLIGESGPWIRVLDDVRLVAGTESPVMIQGETGTGKEVAARAVHSLSSQASGPFVAVNCSAMSENLAESELFGHERGAFTGAHSLRKGRFELAHNGTLFLDEIGDLPLEIQPKLLRVLQEGTFERLGGERTLSVNVRLITASHIDLLDAVANNRFREDLYYRLSVFPITIPPLRERGEDIILLADFFLSIIRNRPGFSSVQFSTESIDKLLTYHWPGNVRELKNNIERAAILSRGKVIQADHLVNPAMKQQKNTYKHSFGDTKSYGALTDLDSAVRTHILHALQMCKGKIYGQGGAAELLNVKPSTLQSKMKRLGISNR